MKKQNSIYIFLGLFILVTSATGLAHEKVPSSFHCEEEADRYCADVEPGHGRIWQCLKKNESKLSSDCRRHVQSRKVQTTERQEIEKVCKSDRKKHCKYVPWSDIRIHKCLKTHESELSQKCREALE